MGLRYRLIPLCVLALSILWPLQSAQAQATLMIGVAPHTSARKLLQQYQPLREYLAEYLNKPVIIQSAPDFDQFMRRALSQDYDLVITTGHQARLLQISANYQPLLTYKADFKALAVVAKQGNIHRVSDLAGRRALGLSQTSLVTLWGQGWLRDQQLETTLEYVSASDSIARELLTHHAEVGFISLANWEVLPSALREQLQILAESPAMLGRVYLLNQRLRGQQPRISRTLWQFGASSVGQQYFSEYALGGYRNVTDSELEVMTPYAVQVRQRLRLEIP